MSLFPGAEDYSITHHHLFGILATEITRRNLDSRGNVRILDVGSGSGSLMRFLQTALGNRFPNTVFELHGLDVSDSRVQTSDYFHDALTKLMAFHPNVPWTSRLTLLRSADDWPYQDEYYDFVVSNQVMEHIRDHQHLFKNLARVLRASGFSAHLFPLRNSWMEWHVKIPFAHWIANGDVLYSYIRLASLLGLGTWRKYCRKVKPISLGNFATMNRDFIALETNYLRERDIERFAKLTGLKFSFRYTEELYFNRLRLALKRDQDYDFASRSPLFHWLRLIFLKRVSSITLTLEKDNIYFNCGLHTPDAVSTRSS